MRTKITIGLLGIASVLAWTGMVVPRRQRPHRGSNCRAERPCGT